MRYSLRIGFLTLAALLFCGKTIKAQEASLAKLPTTIQECEEKSESYNCLVWHWNGKDYSLAWNDGNDEKISVHVDKVQASTGEIDATFTRNVESGIAKGLRVVYRARLRNGAIEKGQATWTYQGIEQRGTWGGVYSSNPVIAKATPTNDQGAE